MRRHSHVVSALSCGASRASSSISFRLAGAMVCALSLFVSAASAVSGLTPGSVDLKSAGPMTFASSGVLIIGDPKAAEVFALDTGDAKVAGDLEKSLPSDLRAAVASTLGAGEVTINDLAVNPETGNVMLSVTAGDAVCLVRLGRDGQLSKLDLSNIAHARKALPNPPADKVSGSGRRARNLRDESITDVAFFDGKVIVSGASDGDQKSAVVEFPFPFAKNTIVTNVEIYHAAHGRVEDPAIRTFVPMNLGGKPSLLAGFTCTPLVNFPLADLGGDEKVRGKTIAELGNRNRPIDMFVYEKDGAAFLLLSNTVRGVMKVSTDGIDDVAGLTEKVSGGGTAGQSLQTIESLVDVSQMDKLSETQGIALVGKPTETQILQIFDLP